MDATLKGVLSLVDAAEVEARCAALVVLTHLGAEDERVVRVLGETLNSKNVVVRDFALGYFEKVRPRDGVPHLVPLLDSPDDPIRQRVAATLAAYGAAAVSAVRKQTKEAPRRRINAIIDICARVRSAAALDLLFDLMAAEDFDSGRAACDALVAIVPALDAKARGELLSRAEKLAAGSRGHRAPMVAAAKLFGALADPKPRGRLFPMLDAREPAVVRTHALAALVSCLRGQKLTATEIDTLIPLLDEEDEAGFLRPTIRLLEDQPFDRRHLNTLNRLAENPQPLVKRFAVQKLGGFDSTAVTKTLIGYLTDDSHARRSQAANSLKAMPGARAALMKELLACEDERKAWTIAEILGQHDRSWKRETTDALWKKVETALDTRDDRLFSPYFQFLRGLDADAVAERVRHRAERLRRSKRYAEAARTLALLKDTAAFDDETRLACALAEMKAHPHTLATVGRRQDPALELLSGLAASSFPLGERLRRDKTLLPEELYCIAFHLAEGRPAERSLARDLLSHVAQKFGRAKAGIAAKNKLRLLPPDE